MWKKLCGAASAAALALSSTAFAQSLTPEDVKAQIDAALGDQNAYQELLSNPDPRRSREAMRIMMQSGDADLARMALDFGLTSSDPVVQRMALEGFFSNAPALQISFDASGAENASGFGNDIRQMKGSIDDKMQGYVNARLGAWDEGQGCWTWDGKTCAVRLTDASSAIFFQGFWYPMELKDGVLTGISNMYYTKEPVPFTIPVVR